MSEVDSKLRALIAAAGGPNEVARKLSITTQSIRLWYASDKVPLDRCEEFCAIVGCAPQEANSSLQFAVEYGRRQGERDALVRGNWSNDAWDDDLRERVRAAAISASNP